MIKDTKNWEEEKIKTLLRMVFFTGYDQGTHGIRDPNFEGFYENCWEEYFKKIAFSLLSQAREEEKLNTKIDLLGLFHGVLKDMYGKEIADMVINRVGKTFSMLSSEDKEGK